jgi:hypothetical protein
MLTGCRTCLPAGKLKRKSFCEERTKDLPAGRLQRKAGTNATIGLHFTAPK